MVGIQAQGSSLYLQPQSNRVSFLYKHPFYTFPQRLTFPLLPIIKTRLFTSNRRRSTLRLPLLLSFLLLAPQRPRLGRIIRRRVIRGFFFWRLLLFDDGKGQPNTPRIRDVRRHRRSPHHSSLGIHPAVFAQERRRRWPDRFVLFSS